MAANISEDMWREMVAKIKELEEKVKKEKEPSVGYLTNKKSFGEVPKYNGKAELYDDWRFKFCNFLYEEDGWIQIVRKLDRMLTTPTVDELEKFKDELLLSQEKGLMTAADIYMKSSQLYLCLCSKLDGASLTSIKNLEAHDLHVGFKAWLKVAHECTHMSAQRVQSLVVRIHQPKRVKKYSDVNPAIDDWESLLKQYELLERTTLADAMKVFALRQIVPEELDRDIYKNNSLTDYITTKSYVQTQVNIRRDLPSKPSGIVPMELDAAYLADVTARKAMLATLGWGTQNGNTEEKNCGHDHQHQPEHRDQQDTNYEEETTDEAKSINALLELVKVGGDTAIHAAQALSMVKGGKGYNKGKGKSWGNKEQFQGNCSHCGKWGHRLNECRIKDREMEQWRKGKSTGKGFQSTGKGGGYQGKGHNNHWNNSGKGNATGYGKGGTNYMNSNSEWANSSAATSWAFSLQKTPPGQDADGFTPVSRSSTGKIISDLCAPPGLHLNYFDSLGRDDIEEIDNEDTKDDGEEYSKNYPDMKNYSKGSVRRAGAGIKQNNQQKRKKREYKKVNECFMFEKQPVQKEINAFAAAPDSEGYIKITGVMDSGASESVAPPTMCPQFDIKPSPGSIIGQNYVSASNGVMYNVGEQILPVVTSTGKESAVKYQMVDKVTRPLNSVSEICDAGGPRGQHVIFGRSGGVILNLDTGDQTPFGRTENIYTLDMWVKPQTGFTRRD